MDTQKKETEETDTPVVEKDDTNQGTHCDQLETRFPQELHDLLIEIDALNHD
jgi:hypothetical protein